MIMNDYEWEHVAKVVGQAQKVLGQIPTAVEVSGKPHSKLLLPTQ